MKTLPGVLLALACTGPAQASDYTLDGFLDTRLVAPASATSWTEGGLAKTRFSGGNDLQAQLPMAGVAARAQPWPELSLIADLQYQHADREMLQVIEAYARYRPVSITPWRWQLRGGFFFPPISLENDSIGWTSWWTLTPSAINSWVGEELRDTGVELRLERRGEIHSFEVGATAFWANDPAGELLAARGWSLSDLTLGLGGKVREPDVYARRFGASVPLRFDPFQEIDHRTGWHADLTWRSRRHGRLTLLRYDNNADPATHTSGPSPLFTWRTYFWSLAGETRIGNLVLMAQAMDGATIIEPRPGRKFETGLHAGYLLAGLDLGRWRPALRLDAFSLSPGVEHGNAVTAALTWRPYDWLRLTAEVLRVDSWREQRSEAGEPPRLVETQVQIGARFLWGMGSGS